MWSLALLVIVGALAAVVLRDAVSVARTLLAVSDDMLDARSAARIGDLERADNLLRASRARLRGSASLTNRPLWETFERIPLVGNSLTTARLVTETADEAARVGRSLIGKSDVVIDDSGRLLIGLEGRRLTVEQMVVAADAIAAVNLDAFDAALQELEGSPATWMPAQVRAARTEVIRLGREVLSTLEHAEQSLRVVPAFAGANGTRRYFLAMQNPAELRGTGGLIGFFSVLTASNGEFDLSEPETYDVIDRPGVLDPGTRGSVGDDEFDRRYGAAQSRHFIANVNLDGDLETVGPVLRDLAQRQLAVPLDGVVLVDPVGLARAMGNVGPVDVPDEFIDPTGQIPDPLPAHLIPAATMSLAYDVFGSNTEERDDYLRELATAAFNQLFDGGWDPIVVSQDIAAAALSRHIQVWTDRPDELALFRSLNVSGALDTRHDGDHVAVTGVNAASNKLDYYTQRRIDVTLWLNGPEPDATRTATVEVVATNEAPADELDSYVAGSGTYDPARRFSVRDGPHGLNRTWFTVWGPPSSRLLRVESLEGGAVERPISDALSRALAVDRTVTMMPGESDGFRATLSAPAHLRRVGPDREFEFVLRRQPSAVADDVSITVHAPRGWDILEAEAVQTAEPILPAARSDFERVDGDGSVTFRGPVDADVHVRITLTRPLADRLADWFRLPV